MLSLIGCGLETCLETAVRGHQRSSRYVPSQEYCGKLVFACSKNAGIRARLVSESSGALPSYIRRSLESVQNFLLKYLLFDVVFKGSKIQLIVAFLSLSKEELGRKPRSAHTRLLQATWICSSLEMSADTVLRAASPQNLLKGKITKNTARSATNAFNIV